MSWWYYAHGNRRWNWGKAPTFRCRYDQRDHVNGEPAPTRPEIVEAAQLLAVAPQVLQRLVERAHGPRGSRARIDGKLTDRCQYCGRRMTKLGYRVWIDEVEPDPKVRAQAKRLGFQPPRRTIAESVRFFDRKDEAQRWAHSSRSAAKGEQ